jgi:hypothetical protein
MQKLKQLLSNYLVAIIMLGVVFTSTVVIPIPAEAYTITYSQPEQTVSEPAQAGITYSQDAKRYLPTSAVKANVTSSVEIATKAAKVTKETIAKGTKYATDLYIIDSGKPGPVVWVSGGVHGNETAGYTAAKKVTGYEIKKGKLLVLPEANKRAISADKRYVSPGDLNRDFPTTKSGSADSVLAKAILKAMKDHDVDWVMDMHEGYDYYKVKSTDSVGQSVIYYPSSKMTPLAKDIVNTLNKGISTSYKKFSLLKYPAKGSLARSAAVVCGANAFIFETCWKPALSTRVNYQLKALNILLDELNMR